MKRIEDFTREDKEAVVKYVEDLASGQIIDESTGLVRKCVHGNVVMYGCDDCREERGGRYE